MTAVFLQQYAQALGVEDIQTQNEIVARALDQPSPVEVIQSVVDDAEAVAPVEEGS